MLTLTDIKNITFRKASIGGYRSDEVDNFIDSVIASYEVLQQELEQQKEKLASATEKIETYRVREESIGAALMNAQHQADLVIREADHRSQAMLQDAQQEAEHILAQAKIKIEEEEASLQKLKKEISSFKSKLMSLYKEHLLLIDALPGEEPTGEEMPQPEATLQSQQEEQPAEAVLQQEPVESTPPVPAEEEPEPVKQEQPAASEPEIDQEGIASSAFFEASDFTAPAEEEPSPQQAMPSDSKVSSQEEEIHGFTVDLTAFENIADELPPEPSDPQRFGTLKFGDDYDITNDDDMKTPFSKFKRRK